MSDKNKSEIKNQRQQGGFRRNYVPFEKKGISFPVDKEGKVITKTKQAMRDECDINNIVALAARTGFLPNHGETPVFGDFTQVADYRDALQTVINAQEAFQGLPATVRDQFANDPERFLEFATNPANAQAMVDMGLATLRPQETPPEPAQGGKKGGKQATPPSGKPDGDGDA